MMIPYDQMPEDNRDLAKLDVTFPFLDDNLEKACPESINTIVEYLRLESPDFHRVVPDQLTFCRTAQVAERKYWIWTFVESDGTDCYVTVSQDEDGSTCIGYEQNYGAWTPEQFMLGDYHDVF
jgi:hypothetical protein